MTEGRAYYVKPGDIVCTKAGDEHDVVEVYEDLEAFWFEDVTPAGGRIGHLHRDADKAKGHPVPHLPDTGGLSHEQTLAVHPHRRRRIRAALVHGMSCRASRNSAWRSPSPPWTSTREALAKAKGQLGLNDDQLYSSAAQALDELKPDFINIVVPPAFHEQMVDLAVAHGCHILSEKPIADTMEASCRIYHKVKRAGLKMAVTMSHRFDQDKQTLERAIKSGDYGRLSSLIGRNTWNCRKFGSWGKFRHEIPDRAPDRGHRAPFRHHPRPHRRRCPDRLRQHLEPAVGRVSQGTRTG